MASRWSKATKPKEVDLPIRSVQSLLGMKGVTLTVDDFGKLHLLPGKPRRKKKGK